MEVVSVSTGESCGRAWVVSAAGRVQAPIARSAGFNTRDACRAAKTIEQLYESNLVARFLRAALTSALPVLRVARFTVARSLALLICAAGAHDVVALL